MIFKIALQQISQIAEDLDGRPPRDQLHIMFWRKAALELNIVAAVLTATPALAQTYDPKYPVCLQTYGIDGGYIGCGYTSLAQCNATASGRAAQCITNPYFAGATAGGTTAAPRRLLDILHSRLSG